MNDLLQEGRSESTPKDLLTGADASSGAVVGLEPASFWFGDLCGRRRRGGTPIAADSVQPACRRHVAGGGFRNAVLCAA
jgi:hypothetical protein